MRCACGLNAVIEPGAYIMHFAHMSEKMHSACAAGVTCLEAMAVPIRCCDACHTSSVRECTRVWPVADEWEDFATASPDSKQAQEKSLQLESVRSLLESTSHGLVTQAAFWESKACETRCAQKTI